MGCDFYYSGKLPNPDFQKMVIHLVKSYYSETHEIHPFHERIFFTRILQKNKDQITGPGAPPSMEETFRVDNVKKFFSDVMSPDTIAPTETFFDHLFVTKKWNIQEKPYPFNFFGVIPSRDIKYRTGQNHFVFDRTAGGELVTLTKLPDQFNPTDDHKQEGGFSEDDDTIEVEAKSGGYCRMIGGEMSFSLLLHIIRLRYWPDFSFSDDYNVSIKTGDLIKEFQLESTLKNWRYNFNDCQMFFWNEYELWFPSKNIEKLSSSPPPERLFKPILDEVQNIPIDKVELSVRSSRLMKKAGIKTVGELATYSPEELYNIDKNFTRKCLKEVIETLWQVYGVHLRPE